MITSYAPTLNILFETSLSFGLARVYANSKKNVRGLIVSGDVIFHYSDILLGSFVSPVCIRLLHLGVQPHPLACPAMVPKFWVFLLLVRRFPLFSLGFNSDFVWDGLWMVFGLICM